MAPRAKILAQVGLTLLTTMVGCTMTDPSVSDVSPMPSASSALETSAAEASELTAGPLPAARYTRAGFTPRVSFELDGSWRFVQQGNGFFDVQQDVGSPDVIAVQFARPTGIYGGGIVSEEVSDADHAVELIRANSGLTVLETSESLIGGVIGSQVTVENAGNGHARVMQVPIGALGIDEGRRLWIGLFDTPQGLLAIMIGGSVAKWDEALAAAEPVLESIRIDP
jgi:hypothetical protein